MTGLWKKGGRGRRTHRMERWQAEIRLYKTHLSSTTMEKVKAHDRYKHICYWVLQLLYFDSLVSTHVGSFDSIPLRYPAWILFIPFFFFFFYSTVIWLFILQMYSAHPQKSKPSSVTSCKRSSFCLWHWDVQWGTARWVFAGGVQYRPMRAHTSDDTYRMLGIITFFFCLFKLLKLKFIQCDNLFFFFL